METFVLDLNENINEAPLVEGYNITLRDPSTLTVEVDKSQAINEVFNELTRLNIHVTSMRNKSNRLEELFVNLVKQGGAQ